MSSGLEVQVMQNRTRLFFAPGCSLNLSTKCTRLYRLWVTVSYVSSIYQKSQISEKLVDLLLARIWPRWYFIPSAIDSASGQNKSMMSICKACYLSGVCCGDNSVSKVKLNNLSSYFSSWPIVPSQPITITIRKQFCPSLQCSR